MIRRLVASLLILLAGSVQATAAVVFVPIYIPMPAIVPGAKPANYDGIHTIAVISAIGDYVNLRNNHFMGPKTGQIDIRNWKIDDEVAARVQQYLSPRFSFKNVPFDHDKLANLPTGVFDNFIEHLPDFLNTLPRDVVDAYVVVRPILAYRAPGLKGLGLENGAPFGDATPVVWTNFEIDIVDAHTSKVIGQAYSRVRLRDKTPPAFSGIFVSDTLKVGDDFNLTETQLNLLHGDISTMLNLVLVETLRSLDMGINLPNPGTRGFIPIPPDQNPYKGYKTVAITSVLGDEIQLDHMGGTVFSESNYRLAEPDWHIDDHVEKSAEEALSKQFTVVKPVIDREALSHAVMWDEDGKLAPKFPGLPQDGQADLYILFLDLNARMAGVHFTKGLGLFNHTPITAEPNVTAVFAHFAVVVIDGKSLKYIVARGGLTSPDFPSPLPQDDVNAADWPNSPPSLSAEQSTDIHDALFRLVDDSTHETLLQLGLLGILPTQAAPLPDVDGQK